MTRALVLHDAALANEGGCAYRDRLRLRRRLGARGAPRLEVELLVGAGLEPHEALAAATRNGGTLLGHDHAGCVEEGHPADLVLVHGDPLSDARALWRVWSVYQLGVRVA